MQAIRIHTSLRSTWSCKGLKEQDKKKNRFQQVKIKQYYEIFYWNLFQRDIVVLNLA